MRIACAACLIVCLLALSYNPSQVRAQDVSSVPFVTSFVTDTPLADGFYVFRDEAEWADKFAREYPTLTGPPPAPDFTDSLVVAVSYGMSGCSGTGGWIKTMDLIEDTVRIHLGHVYGFNIVCLAELPRQSFYRVAHADVPSDAVFAFHPAELPYDVEPEQWYPLAVGNAWHFQDYPDTHRVEVIDEMIEVNGAGWYRIVEAFSSDDARPAPTSRYMRWTDDAFLLTSTDPAAYADTVHAGFLESPFLVNVPRAVLPMSGGETRSVRVGVNAFSQFFNGFVALWVSWDVSYLQGVGPLEGLVAAIIDGEHFEDTSLLQTVLSSEQGPQAGAGFDLSVYPNPSLDPPTVSFTSPGGRVTIQIFDVLGRQVSLSERNVIPGERWRERLDSEGLAAGTYFVRIQTERGEADTRAFTLIR